MEEINASHLIAALGESFSVISFWCRKDFAVEMGFGIEKRWRWYKWKWALGGGGAVC